MAKPPRGKDKSYITGPCLSGQRYGCERGAMRVKERRSLHREPGETDLAPACLVRGEPVAPLSTIGRRAIAIAPSRRPDAGDGHPLVASREPGKDLLADFCRRRRTDLSGDCMEVVGQTAGSCCISVRGSGRPARRMDLLERATE